MKPITAKAIADAYGFTPRHWIKLAAAGKVPGAYQPGGAGGRWLFDLAVFSRWYQQSGRKVSLWPGYTNEERPIGRVLKGMVESSESPLRQQIDGLLSDALKTGRSGSKPSRGATVHELHFVKR